MMIIIIHEFHLKMKIFHSSLVIKSLLLLALILFSLLSWNQLCADSSLEEGNFDPENAFKVLEMKFPPVNWIEKHSGAELAWHESYRIMAYLAMYEGTQDTSYISKAIHRIDAVINKRDDKIGVVDEIRNRVIPAWSSTIYTDEKNYAWAIHAGMITYPIIQCAYVISQDSVLSSKYINKVNYYIRSVKETIEGFEPNWRVDDGRNEGWYYGDYLKRVIPLNQQNALGRTLVVLWMITGERKYYEKALKLANYFKNCLIEKDTHYLWLYWGHYGLVEDISHAAINIDFAYLCYRAGIIFTLDDMKRFTKTFMNCVQEEGFSKFIDGEGDLSLSVEMGRWAHLTYIDNNLRHYLVNYFRKNWLKNYRTTFLALAYLVETQNIEDK